METDKYGYGHAECEKLCSVQGRDVQWAIREESGVQQNFYGKITLEGCEMLAHSSGSHKGQTLEMLRHVVWMKSPYQD